MIFFVDSLTGGVGLEYQAHAMEVDNSPPFDVGNNDGFYLWYLSRPRVAVRYRSSGFEGIISRSRQWASGVEWLKEQVYAAAGAFGALTLQIAEGELIAPLFLSSCPDSVPMRYELRVDLHVQRLIEIPEVVKSIALIGQLAGGEGGLIGGEFNLEGYCRELKEFAAAAAPEVGLMVPCHVGIASEKRFGVLQLVEQSGAGDFRAIVYIEDHSAAIRAGSPIHRELHWDGGAADQLLGTVVQVIDGRVLSELTD